MFFQQISYLLSIIQRSKHSYLKCIKKHKFSESCLKDIFSAVNGNYNIRFQFDFRVLGITIFYGTNSIRHSGSVIWNSRPNDLAL